jgi:hypothetical protein
MNIPARVKKSLTLLGYISTQQQEELVIEYLRESNQSLNTIDWYYFTQWASMCSESI